MQPVYDTLIAQESVVELQAYFLKRIYMENNSSVLFLFLVEIVLFACNLYTFIFVSDRDSNSDSATFQFCSLGEVS